MIYRCSAWREETSNHDKSDDNGHSVGIQPDNIHPLMHYVVCYMINTPSIKIYIHTHVYIYIDTKKESQI